MFRIATHAACAVGGAAVALAGLVIAIRPAAEHGRRVLVTQHRLAVLTVAIEDYRMSVGGYPPGLEPSATAAEATAQQSVSPELRQFLTEDVPVDSDGKIPDGWGRPIRYRLLECAGAGRRLEVISDGPNGIAQEGGGDDEIWITPLK